jgi:hypothetical protein
MAPLIIFQSDGTASVWLGISQALAEEMRTATKITDQAGNVVSVQSYLPGSGIVANGTPGSGYIINGCPLNVWFNNTWLDGQQADLQQDGVTACLPKTNPDATDPVPTRCYYQDGSITTTLTECPPTNSGVPLLQSENQIISDVSNTPPWSMILLIALGLYLVTKK